MSEENSTPLWFLLRNPRALGEVEDWLKLRRQENEKFRNQRARPYRRFLFDELLADIQKQYEINFPTLGKQQTEVK